MPESMNPRLSASPKVPVPRDLEKQPVKSLPSDGILDNLHRTEVRGSRLTNKVKELCDTKIKAVRQKHCHFHDLFLYPNNLLNIFNLYPFLHTLPLSL